MKCYCIRNVQLTFLLHVDYCMQNVLSVLIVLVVASLRLVPNTVYSRWVNLWQCYSKRAFKLKQVQGFSLPSDKSFCWPTSKSSSLLSIRQWCYYVGILFLYNVICIVVFQSYTCIASHGNWCTGTLLNRIITAQWEGIGGCRVGEVWADTTSAMPDNKGFKLP